MEHRRAVVTGGSGFIGSHMVAMLCDAEYETHSIDIVPPSSARHDSRATYHDVDVRSYDDVAKILHGATYVFHMAAKPRVQYSIDNPVETFAINAMGTINVLRAAHTGGVKRVVHSSSGAVYGDISGILSETMSANPMSPYALQKHISERACRLWSDIYNLSTVSLRYLNVYGAHMDPFEGYALVLPVFLQLRKERKPLTIAGDGTHTRDYVHVSDVVSANMLAAESAQVGTGEVINIGTGKETSVNDIAVLIGGETIPMPPRIEPARACADISLARKLLDWGPTIKLEDSIPVLKKEFGIL